MERDQSLVTNETQVYSVPWRPIDNWVGVFLLVLINIGLLLAASQEAFSDFAQSAILILVQLVYLLPLLVVFTYRRVNPLALGFGKFDWNILGIGCGLLIASYMIILIHNIVLMLLGVNTQGEQIMQLLDALESPVWFVLVGVVFAPMVEELFFRGFLFQGFRQKYGWMAGLLFSSSIFAAAHLDPVAFVPTFILGCLLAYIYHRSNSVWPGVILHMLVNAFGLCVTYAATQIPGLIPV